MVSSYISICTIVILATLNITQAIINPEDNDYNGKEADRYDWSKHPCHRPCKDGGKPKVCYYVFVVEMYMTMSKACYSCPYNMTDCSRPHCLTGDGTQKVVFVANRNLPGTNIEVCEGDKVIIDVRNLMQADSTSIHWHGLRQMETPYMDGVPFVTQCPILSQDSFRYNFEASQSGTYFWHSHIGGQRADGLFGGLIIRAPPKSNPHKDLYDYDVHSMVIIDWKTMTEEDFYARAAFVSAREKPSTILINGLGRHKNFAEEGEKPLYTPSAVFKVKKGYKYRFRLVNAGADNCPIQMSIDNHTMQVISADGNDIKPVEVDSIYTWPGERYDFVINANQDIDNYWFRYRGYGKLCNNVTDPASRVHQVAILRYTGAKNQDPKAPTSWDIMQQTKRFRELNPYDTGSESNKAVSVNSLRSILPNDQSNRVREPDHRFYIKFDLNPLDNYEYHRSSLYGFNQVERYDVNATMGSYQFNHISFKMPPFPVLSQRNMVTSDMFCNETTVSKKNCSEEHCACTYVLQVKLNSLVELVLIDEGHHDAANHPIHLHGHFFRVLATEKLNGRVTLDRVKKLDRQGKIKRNFNKAPLKDTIKVPSSGYSIIRFYADNPGYWFYHCHFEQHTELGLALIFKVGEHEDMQPVPRNFPQCGSYLPKIM